MPPLQKGARELTDQLLADLAQLSGGRDDLLQLIRTKLAEVPVRVVRDNPGLVADVHEEIRQVLDEVGSRFDADLASMRRRIEEQLVPMLQRREHGDARTALTAQVTQLQEQVRDLAERVAALEDSRLIRLRREG